MLPITPERLAAVYQMLRAFPPFNIWKLPPAEEVVFHVSKTDQHHAAWWVDDGERHHIEVSEKKHGHLHSLVATMAHELIHAYQRVNGTETKGEHNAEFKRLARRVCMAFGFDPGQFNG